MPDLIVPDHARTMFAQSWTDAMEQKQSRLRDKVTLITGCTGDTATIDIAGSSDGEDVTGQRFKEVAISELATRQRFVYPSEYQKSSHESKWDSNSIAPLVAPTGKAATEHMAAFSRFTDRLLLTQILGNASERTTGTVAPTTVALPAAQKIAKDYVASGSATDSNLTVEKLLYALQLFEEAEVWGQDQMEMGAKVCIATNSKANKALLLSVQSGIASKLMSKDFMPPTIDENGHISTFLGIHFVRTELVSVTSGVALCPMWVSNCVQLNFWGDYQVSIDRLPTRSQALQFLSQARLGATRIFDTGVAQIACKQA